MSERSRWGKPSTAQGPHVPTPDAAPQSASGESRWTQPGTPPLAPQMPQATDAPPARLGRRLPSGMNKPLMVTVGVVPSVVLVVSLIWVISTAKEPGQDDVAVGPVPVSAGAAVREYLEALARGDAAAALAYSDTAPAAGDLLTNEVLAQQIATWPITNISIVSEDIAGDVADVHVTADFGDQTSDATVLVSKNDAGHWRLRTAAIKVAGSESGMVPPGAAKTATLFGQPIAPAGTYVFPGYLDVGSTNPYLDVGPGSPLLLDTLNLPADQTMYAVGTFDLSDAGRRAARDAVDAGFAFCRQSNLLRPGLPCPMGAVNSQRLLVEGSATWGDYDISEMQPSFDPASMMVTLTGRVTATVTNRDVQGNLWLNRLSGEGFIDVDLTHNPLVLTRARE